jgi:hypothetical protein
LSEADLIAAVKKEGTLTHSNPIAVDSTVAFVLICRALIEGKSLEEGIRHAKKHVESLEVRSKPYSNDVFRYETFSLRSSPFRGVMVLGIYMAQV